MNKITTAIKNFNKTNQETLLNSPIGTHFKIIAYQKYTRNNLDKAKDLNYFVGDETFTMEHPTDMDILLFLYEGLVDGTCRIVPST